MTITPHPGWLEIWKPKATSVPNIAPGDDELLLREGGVCLTVAEARELLAELPRAIEGSDRLPTTEERLLAAERRVRKLEQALDVVDLNRRLEFLHGLIAKAKPA